jgi:hypothetical protein
MKNNQRKSKGPGKGDERTGAGRKKGTQNRLNADVKAAIMEALDAKSGRGASMGKPFYGIDGNLLVEHLPHDFESVSRGVVESSSTPVFVCWRKRSTPMAPGFPPSWGEPTNMFGSSRSVLRTGMVMSVEPALFLKGERLGVRLIDNVLGTSLYRSSKRWLGLPRPHWAKCRSIAAVGSASPVSPRFNRRLVGLEVERSALATGRHALAPLRRNKPLARQISLTSNRR